MGKSNFGSDMLIITQTLVNLVIADVEEQHRLSPQAHFMEILSSPAGWRMSEPILFSFTSQMPEQGPQQGEERPEVKIFYL